MKHDPEKDEEIGTANNVNVCFVDLAKLLTAPAPLREWNHNKRSYFESNEVSLLRWVKATRERAHRRTGAHGNLAGC